MLPMKNRYAWILFPGMLCAVNAGTAPTQPAPEARELIILGTVHFPTAGVKPDSLFAVLDRLKPGMILMEMDHSAFDDRYGITLHSGENEWMALGRYLAKYPETAVRPFDIEGRKAIRRSRGIDLPVVDSLFDYMLTLDSLGAYEEEQENVLRRFLELTDTLNRVAQGTLRRLNNPGTDSLVRERQHCQYVRLLEVTGTCAAFPKWRRETEGTVLDGREIFRRYAAFELEREQRMTENILNWIGQARARRIVVMVGFFHRYALMEKLEPLQSTGGFRLIDPFR